MAEVAKKRRRPAVSCALCRQRKIRCNREVPCNNCLRSKNAICVYEPQHQQPPPQPRLGDIQAIVPRPARQSGQDLISSHVSTARSIATASEETRLSGNHNVQFIEHKIKALEEELASAKKLASESPSVTQGSHIDIEDSCLAPGVRFRFDSRLSNQVGTETHFRYGYDSRFPSQAPTASRTVFHKTRLFGQSHWMNSISLLREVFAAFDQHAQENNTSRVHSGLNQCKLLGKTIKSLRNPPWPCSPTFDLPSREVADKLVDCYLRTTETVYRVLHIPTFKRDYAAVWMLGSEQNTAFFVLLKLVLALGAVCYDDLFTLRPSAIRWIYEAHTWASHPQFKCRLNTTFLQINILLTIARELVNVGDELVWVSSGALLRTARHMGFHRDPMHLPKTSRFIAEMRRRLWNSILELSLQSSLSSGGPPFISMDDFDTEPPRNFDDEQLEEDDQTPRPASDFTQTSVAIHLRSSFPLRLAIIKSLNDLSSNVTYEDVLRLDAGMKLSHKDFRRKLQDWMSRQQGHPSSFTLNLVDLLTHRYVSSLHIPYFGLATQQSTYTYSRKIVVDNAFKAWYTIYPSSSTATLSQYRHNGSPSYTAETARFVRCSTGVFHIIASQASVLLSAEINTQLREEENLGPGLLRLDLLAILDDAKAFCLQRVESGETNMKGYLFHCLIAAHVKGLMQGMSRDDLPALMIKTAEEASEICIPILERKVAEIRATNRTPGFDDLPLDTAGGLGSDWNFMTDNTFFDYANMEQMNWTFSDGASVLPNLYDGASLLHTQ